MDILYAKFNLGNPVNGTAPGRQESPMRGSTPLSTATFVFPPGSTPALSPPLNSAGMSNPDVSNQDEHTEVCVRLLVICGFDLLT